MKKFIQKLLLFILSIIIIDIIFGICFQYMNDHSKGGGIKNRYYVCKESNEEVLIFGSSRAKHHYVPDIIEENLNMTCYNTGEDGNGIILCYGFLKMITERYTPKIIIYDVTGFDIYEDDNNKYLDLLKPFYYEPGIAQIFWSVNPDTRLMMLSNLYRYNTTCLRVLGNYIHPMTSYPKGYYALHKTIDYEPEINDRELRNIDNLKISYFSEFIHIAQEKNIKIICCVSPIYMASMDDSYYEPIQQLCKQNKVPFLYFGADSLVSKDKKCFADRTHMNDHGARKFTTHVTSMIKGI